MWRPWSLQQINACFPAHPYKIKAHSRSAWTLPLIPKCEMEFKRNFLKNFGALTGFLLWFSSRLEQIGACLRSFVCSGWVFNQRWSMEAKRMQVFLSLCKLDLQSALRPVSSASLCLEKARKASALGGGATHNHFQAHGSPIEVFHLHIQYRLWEQMSAALLLRREASLWKQKRECLQLPRGKRLAY